MPPSTTRQPLPPSHTATPDPGSLSTQRFKLGAALYVEGKRNKPYRKLQQERWVGFAEQLGNTWPEQWIWGYLCSIKLFCWGTLCLTIPYLGLDCTVSKLKAYHLVAMLLIGPKFFPKTQVLNI